MDGSFFMSNAILKMIFGNVLHPLFKYIYISDLARWPTASFI
jgi:hypothetical protein